MPTRTVLSDESPAVVPLGHVKDKRLKSLELAQADDALSVDLRFEDDTVLELTFRVRFEASVNVLALKNGNYRILKRIKPRQRP